MALCAFAAVVALAIAASAAADRSDDRVEITGLAMDIATAPNPVLGVDGKNHLAYEITIINRARSTSPSTACSRGRGASAWGPPSTAAPC